MTRQIKIAKLLVMSKPLKLDGRLATFNAEFQTSKGKGCNLFLQKLSSAMTRHAYMCLQAKCVLFYLLCGIVFWLLSQTIRCQPKVGNKLRCHKKVS